MVLNPRGVNDKYEVEAAMADVRAMGELRFNDTPQGRFLSQLRGSYNHVPSAYGAGEPMPVAAGQAIGQSGIPVHGHAPDLYAVQPSPVEVYRAEDAVDATPGGTPGGDVDEHGCKPSTGYHWCESQQKCIPPGEKCPDANVVKARGFIDGLGKWPVAPLIIGGALLLVFYAVYRALK
jgi:hypothetical protein